MDPFERLVELLAEMQDKADKVKEEKAQDE